ncbi:MAG TPA: pyruvate kinase [Anaerolineaceae bacterium]|nr:pyruvate kinase [Anaerolineaceae bacterium]
MDRKAKIVATLGPSSQDEGTLRGLIEAGLDVARLNFSHGTHDDHAARIDMIHRLSEEIGKPVTILQDLQGPKLRVGNLPGKGILLQAGQKVKLASVEGDESSNGPESTTTFIPMVVPDLAGALSVGNRILLDDGHLELQVTGVGENEIEANVVLGGILSSHKGVNLPGSKLKIPGFTEKDKADLEFGLAHGIDCVAISFVKTAQDILTVREAISTFAPGRADTPIIAKLERPEAIDNLEEIMRVTDGVMVARGDLGVETSPSFVPIVQKKIIQEANRQCKMVITATQMLDSMIQNPRPTRAEASDVANAVFDGTDAVMLSGETASGSYPVESVKMMDSIVRAAEEHFTEWGLRETRPEEPERDDAISITRAARELAHDRNVAAIAVFTETGKTALLMSKARPQVPILAFTPELRTFQRLGLFWGVVPFFVPYDSTVEGMITHLEAAIVASTQIEAGQQVVVITGFPVGARIPPNFALLHTIRG